MDKTKYKCELQKQVEQAIKRTGGEDSNIIHALIFHLQALTLSKTEEELESREEMCQALLSKMFLDKMDQYPTQPFVCRVDENSDWPVKPMPSELFGDEKQSDEERIRWFYASLKVGDVLDCRLSCTKIEMTSKIHILRVIHKYGVTRILDDLSIMVELIFENSEVAILKDELLQCELVRVAVSKIDKKDGQVKVYVTVDPANIPYFRLMPNLGRINENDLSSYVLHSPDMEKYSCYADYLNSKPQFYNPHFYIELLKECGINPYTTYSYFPKLHKKECADGDTGQALLKESKLSDAKQKANLALKYLQRKQYMEALKLVEEGLNIAPEKDSVISRLDFIRSDLYAAQSKPASSLKSCCELEKSFNRTPVDDEVKKKYIQTLYETANGLYDQKQYQKAASLYEFILQHDENHSSALKVLTRIKTRHADKLLNLEEESLIGLHEKKKQLLSELKKMS